MRTVEGAVEPASSKSGEEKSPPKRGTESTLGTPALLLQLQRTIGNAAVGRLLRRYQAQAVTHDLSVQQEAVHNREMPEAGPVEVPTQPVSQRATTARIQRTPYAAGEEALSRRSPGRTARSNPGPIIPQFVFLYDFAIRG